MEKKIPKFTICPGKISEAGSWFHYTVYLGRKRFDGSMEDGFSYFPTLITFLEDVIDGKSSIYQSDSPNREIELVCSPVTEQVSEIELRYLYSDAGEGIFLAGPVYARQFIREIYLNLIRLTRNKRVTSYKNREDRFPLYSWEISRSKKIESFLAEDKCHW